MKRMLSLVVMVVLLACGERAVSGASIGGVYAGKYAGEYSRGVDTLIVTQVQGDHFSIERRSRFERKREGVWVKAASVVQYMMADYSDGVLREQRQGIMLYVGVDEIRWGKQDYIKCETR